MLEKEAKVFEEHLADLLKTDLGKFVLIKDEQIIGTYSAVADALEFGYKQFKEKEFFVKEISPLQLPLNFVNNFIKA